MKILFIAYFFPPSGGGGVQRSLKFARYLPEFGIEPLILTGAAPRSSHWAPQDDTLQRQLPEVVQVHRTRPLSATERPYRVRTRVRNWLGLTSPFGLEWRRQAIALGSRLIEEHRPEAILVTMSPFEGAQIGRELARRHHLPWIADLRDPWALDEMQLFSSGLHRRLAARRMRRELFTASHVFMNTPEAARRLVSSFPEFPARRVRSLTNGFDAADFSGPAPATDPDHFTLVHTGTLHGGGENKGSMSRRLNGLLTRSPAGVDASCRSHLHLLRALEAWQADRPDAVRRVRVVLAGVATEADRDLVNRSGVAPLVAFTGYCSHAETIARQRAAHLLFLPMHKLPPGRRATIVPGKLYEYLASERPILAAVPDGDARDIITASGRGHLCEPDDVAQMGRLLRACFAAWEKGRDSVTTNPSFLAPFERRDLTRRLAETLRYAARGAPAPQDVDSGLQPVGTPAAFA
jgi:glycosyltransferase involved in cell wall biosynthesis